MRPEERRQGCGAALLRWLARIALDAGCGRMEWQVLDWNRPAMDFYQRLGAHRLPNWLPYRLTRQQMADMLER